MAIGTAVLLHHQRQESMRELPHEVVDFDNGQQVS